MPGLLLKATVFIGFGVKGLMIQGLFDRSPLIQEGLGLIRKAGRYQTFPYILHRLLRRMQHILLIETVVTQFVVYNLVSRELGDSGTSNIPYQLLYCEKERGLG